MQVPVTALQHAPLPPCIASRPQPGGTLPAHGPLTSCPSLAVPGAHLPLFQHWLQGYFLGVVRLGSSFILPDIFLLVVPHDPLGVSMVSSSSQMSTLSCRAGEWLPSGAHLRRDGSRTRAWVSSALLVSLLQTPLQTSAGDFSGGTSQGFCIPWF